MGTQDSANGPLKVAVVTGGHGFEVVPFHRLFRTLEGIDAYVQHLEDFCCDAGALRGDYDAVIFYTMFTEGPSDEGPWYAGRQREALAALGETRQGIFLLHHAILGWPDWDVWREIAGIDAGTFTAYDHAQTMPIHVADAEHPITAGLGDFETVDETYTMADCDAGNHVLLTTDHPKCVKTIAWTRRYRSARVFCLQLGHDGAAFASEGFREVVRRGTMWVAGRI